MMLPSPTDKLPLCSTHACCPSSARSPRADRSPTPPTALSFTQPAISQQIARLERQLGTRLLVRDARGVTLTPAGEVLLRHAETVLAQLRLAEAEVLAVDRRRAPAPARRRLPERRREHHAAGAGRAARLAPRGRRRDARRRGRRGARRAAQRRARRRDGARLRAHAARAAGRHRGRAVLDDPLLIALPYSHRLAARSAISLADLRDEDWMVCGVGGTCIDSNVVLRACDAAGFEPRITFETEDYSAIMGMVASGMGVALIPVARAGLGARGHRHPSPARRPPGAPGPGCRRHRSPQRAGRCAAGRPAPGRARAPVGRAAARRRCRLTLRLPRGAAPRRLVVDDGRARGAAGRTARDCTRSTSTIAAVCSNGSAITPPVSIDMAASSRPSTSATKSSPLGMRCESSAARRSSDAKSLAAAWRMVSGAPRDVARVGTGCGSRRGSSTRDRDRERSRWSLNMVHSGLRRPRAHRADGASSGLSGLSCARRPLTREKRFFAGKIRGRGQRATAAWSVSTCARDRARREVVVDQPAGLHSGVDRGRARRSESPRS